MAEALKAVGKKATLKAAESLLRGFMPDLQAKIDGIAHRLDHLEGNMARMIDDRVDRQERRLEVTLNALIERLETKADRSDERMAKRMDQLEEKLQTQMKQLEERLQTQMNELDESLQAKIEQSGQKLDAKIDHLEKTVHGVDSRLTHLDGRFEGYTEVIKNTSSSYTDLLEQVPIYWSGLSGWKFFKQSRFNRHSLA